MTWPSYLINLEENVVRRNNSIRQLKALGLDWYRIDAVNGWKLSDTDIVKFYSEEANRYQAKSPLTAPEIGCYISHLKAWERIASGNSAGGFIFEDDFLATPELHSVLAEICDDGGSNWDMIKLFSLDNSPRTITRQPLGQQHEIVIPYSVPSCTLGYGVTVAAAARLADHTIPFFRPVDEDLKFFWETGIRVSLVLPCPITVGVQRTLTGTIGDERRDRDVESFLKRFNYFLSNAKYQLRYKTKLHFHRNKWIKQ